MLSISLVLCFVLGSASLAFPWLLKLLRDKEEESAKTIIISLVLFLSATVFGNIFLSTLEDPAAVEDAGGVLLKIEGIILLVYLLSQYFLQGESRGRLGLVVGLTAIIGYLSQFVTAYFAITGARWMSYSEWEMSDLTLILLVIGTMDMVLTVAIKRACGKGLLNQKKRV